MVLIVGLSPVYAQSEIEKELIELRKLSSEVLKRIELLEKKISTQKKIEEVLSKKIDESKKSEQLSSNSNSLVPHAHKGFIELALKDTVMSLGGRVQLSSYIGDEDNPDSTFRALYRAKENGEKRELSSHIKGSRLWIKTRTSTKLGRLRSLVEFDFYSGNPTEVNSNSHSPRLRHAYVTLGSWTIGQTNSLFTTLYPPESIVDTVNETYARQPLASFRVDKGSFLKYEFSLEQPETTLVDSTDVPLNRKILPADDRWPDFVSRVRYFNDWVEYSVAFILREIRQNRANLIDKKELENSDDAISWGLNTSARFSVWNENDMRVGFQYGEGLGRYLAENAFSAGSINVEGDIKLHKIYGAHLAYRHWWNETFRSTIAVSATGIKNNSSLQALSKKARSTHLNIIWNPMLNTLVGLEYAHLLRENMGGERGSYNLLKLRLSYDF